MTDSYPFYYEVRFKFLAFDDENNVRIESNRKKVDNANPLMAREEAFAIFNEYTSYAKEHNRLKKDDRGNYFIHQPTEMINLLKNEKNFQSNESSQFNDGKQKKFREDISIYIIVTDAELAKEKLGALFTEDFVQTEFEIHKITSYKFEEQFLVDNLQDVEFRLYQLFDLERTHLVEEVFHFGMDYAESGEVKEDGARRVILKTPHIWQSYDEYLAEHGNSEISEVRENVIDYSPVYPKSVDYTDIISKGESNQVEFKPCLVYNFKTGEGGIGVKNIIARAICAFLNTNGGVLFIGVKDNGEVQGIEYDYSLFSDHNKKDRILLEVDSLLVNFISPSIKPLIETKIENIYGKDVLIIEVQKSSRPIFLLNRKSGELKKEMFIRLSASTHQLSDPEDMANYILNNNWRMN